MVVVTPTAWRKLQALAIDANLSASEYLERMIPEVDSE